MQEREVLDSLIHEARSEWRGPVEDAFTLNGVNNAANQDKLCCRLFVALRRFIRALLLMVYEMPEYTLPHSVHAANQDKLCGRLFVAPRRFIRALIRIVYEMPEHTAYNSRSIQLQAEFFGGRLDGNRWRAKLTFATALPSDEMGIVIEKASDDHGRYYLKLDHLREWVLF
jgi:hypothetical protein